MKSKKCKKCKKNKNVDKFYVSYIYKNKKYYSSFCKKCDLQRREQLRKKHWEKDREKAKKNYEKKKIIFSYNTKKKTFKLREKIINYYSDGINKCICCGENRFEFLTIDHINGGGNKHRKKLKKWGIKFYEWLMKNNFPKGFRVLCFNCNLSRGIHKYCPHEKEKHGSVVYISGSYRNKKEYEIHQNILLAERAFIMLAKKNFTVFCPHKNFAYMGGSIEGKKIMDGCLEILSRCDYIYMLPNWKNSIGAKREYRFAQKHKIPLLKILNDKVQLSI